MSARIGLISDVHATAAPLRDALSIFKQEKVDHVICAGDIAGYDSELDETIELLIENNCQCILGNHDVWLIDSPNAGEEKWINSFYRKLPYTLEQTIAGKKLYVVHASPPSSIMEGIRLFDENGNILESEKQYWSDYLNKFPYDILIVGHTHQVFAEQLGDTLVINPGSTKFNHTCAVLNIPETKVEIIPLPGKTPLKVWRWGMIQPVMKQSDRAKD